MLSLPQPKNQSFLQGWFLDIETQKPRSAYCYWVVITPRPSQGTELKIHACIFIHSIHTCPQSCLFPCWPVEIRNYEFALIPFLLPHEYRLHSGCFPFTSVVRNLASFSIYSLIDPYRPSPLTSYCPPLLLVGLHCSPCWGSDCRVDHAVQLDLPLGNLGCPHCRHPPYPTSLHGSRTELFRKGKGMMDFGIRGSFSVCHLCVQRMAMYRFSI